MTKLIKLLPVVCLALAALPTAKADLLFTGSQVGFCCFNVQLKTVSATDVKVTVSLTGGATKFVNSGGPHAGFAFNLSGPAITSANILNPTNLGTFNVGPFVSNGPSMGTFGYYFDNLGSGGSANNAGPLTFDISRASGIGLTDFIANASGYYFQADQNGTTGESGITAPPTTIGSSVPEPTSVLLLGTVALGLIASRRKIFAK